MIEVELFLCRPERAFSDRDPTDPLSGWRCLGRRRIVDLPSAGDQICIAPGEVLKVRGVMHVAEMEIGGETRGPLVRLMVEVLPKIEAVGPAG